MELLMRMMLIFHIASGTTALLAGPVAMTSRKGGQLHRISGRVYAFAMLGVFITAIAIGLYKSLAFLLIIALFSGFLVASGYRAIYQKNLRRDGAQPLDWALCAFGGASAVLLLFWGVREFAWMGHSFGVVSLVFGILLSASVFREVRKLVHPPQDPRHWILAHIFGMGGGYIATATAFLVVNNHTLPPIAAWLLPTAIGIPLINRASRRWKQPKPVYAD